VHSLTTIEARTSVFYARENERWQGTDVTLTASSVVITLGGLYRRAWEEAILPELDSYRHARLAFRDACVRAGVGPLTVPLLKGLEQLAAALQPQPQAA
jgi:hypothetical protein